MIYYYYYLFIIIINYSVTDRFMLVTESEFMLLDPDKSQLGYGVVKFIAFLQVNMRYSIT